MIASAWWNLGAESFAGHKHLILRRAFTDLHSGLNSSLLA
jgi:hypothetical protein